MKFLDTLRPLVDSLPCKLLSVDENMEYGGALLYAGDLDEAKIIATFPEWVEKAFWILENSGVAVRNLPTGKYVALAYKGGQVVISEDIVGDLSEEMHRACTTTLYESMGIQRTQTCLIYTQTPFEIGVFEHNGQHLVFLKTNSMADVVIFSPTRSAQIG